MEPAPDRVDQVWRDLALAGEAAGARSIADLFRLEPDRLSQFTLEGAGIYLDLSKHPWSRSDHGLAIDLARAAGVEAARTRLFAGEAINTSEHRPALHMALRAPGDQAFHALGEPVSGEIQATRRRMGDLATAIRSGAHGGGNGQAYEAIVHIGIGGSDLGPRLVWEALRPLSPQIDLRFVANIDPSELSMALDGLNPARTLVVIVSKSFTTQETLINATAARSWLRAALGAGGDQQMIAVSAAPDLARAFGVPEDQVFGFRDWVGGRYSLWSAVGLSCAIALGPRVFEALLEGAAAMDAHFQSASLEANLPVQLALAHVFNRNALNRPVRAVVPYAQRLRLFPAFLQQLEMESNGKRVDKLGRPVRHLTAASVFGDAGTNGQHAFFQALHQGTDVVPVDILAVAEPMAAGEAAHTGLLANAVAQAEALMVGRSADRVRADLEQQGLSAAEVEALVPQRTFPGNRPSSFLILDCLSPERLGALIALYEHKVFVEGVLWGINSFDQWGVELGKRLASVVLPELEGAAAGDHDPSTADLIRRLKR